MLTKTKCHTEMKLTPLEGELQKVFWCTSEWSSMLTPSVALHMSKQYSVSCQTLSSISQQMFPTAFHIISFKFANAAGSGGTQTSSAV
jgi:hypothetical protein